MPKVIHFEDEPMLRNMYKVRFEQAGFIALGYDYPPKDLEEFICREKPDLIVMDIIMPKMSGFDATKRLKKDERTKNIPIFGLCNLGQQKDIQMALDLGMTDYWVSNKHSPVEVVQKVKEILGLK